MSIAQTAGKQSILPRAPFRARFLAHPLVRVVLGAVASVLPVMLIMMLTQMLLPKPARMVWPMLLAAGLSVLAYRLFVTRIEKRQPVELARQGALHEVGAGMALGASLGLGVAIILAVAGAFVITGSSDSWDFLLKCLPEQIMVAVFEEILFRAVVFRIVERRWGTRTALAATALLFVAAHLPNDNLSAMAMLMTAVASLALSAAYLWTRRIWLPIGMHFGWNFLFDGVFAVPLSGHAARGWLQVSLPGPTWLTGGAYGVEASLLTLLLWGAVTVVMLRQRPRNVLAH